MPAVMEPPAKRRRLDESEIEDSDDDELAYEPQELVARRDPDYRISMKRAYADHKFQATMAHIFEKYGRDFEGIGDEIDMVTGEIVVDNGHLDRMRNERDVGIEPDMLQGAEGTDDEGIFLGDLIGDDEDQSHEALNEEQRRLNQDEEEDRFLRGQPPHHQLDRVATGSKQRSLSNPTRPLSIPADPFHGQPPSVLGGYGYPVGNYGFGTSPFAAGPWDLPPDYAQPAWSAPRPPSFLDFRGGRYDLAGQDDDTSSIWAPGAHKEDHEQAVPLPTLPLASIFRKPVPRSRKKAMPHPRPRVVDENDEDLNLPGKKLHSETIGQDELVGALDEQENKRPPKQTIVRPDPCPSSGSLQCPRQPSPGIDSGPSNCKGKRKAIVPQANRSQETKQDKSSPRQPGTASNAVKSQKNAALHGTVPVAASQSQSIPGIVKGGQHDETAHKHSTSPQGQAISISSPAVRSQVATSRRTSSRMLVELRPMDPQSRKEYIQVDVEDTENEGNNKTDTNSQSATNELVIPDSQTPGSSADLPSPVQREPDETRLEDTAAPDFHDILALSDDEAPTFFLDSKVLKNVIPHLDYTSRPPVVQENAPLSSAPAESSSISTPDGSHAIGVSEVVRQDSASSLGDGESRLPMMEKSHDAESRRISGSHPSLEETQEPIQELTCAPGPTKAEKEALVSALHKHTDPDQSVTDGTTPEVAQDGHAVSATEPQRDNATTLLKTTAHVPAADNEKPAHERSVSATTPSQRELQPPSSQHPDMRNTRQHQPKKKTSAPSTPRHSILRPTKAPSSRRSVLSLVSDDEDDDDWDKELDELGRITGVLSQRHISSGSSSSIVRKLWRSSARTTEVLRTPVKKHRNAPTSPGSTVKTPGGTTRTCGVDGYRCGRDFCFTCL